MRGKEVAIFKRLIISALAVLALSACAFAQKSWGIAGSYDLKSHRASQFVIAPSNTEFDVGSLTAALPDVPKFHFTLDLAPFAGAGTNGSGTLGVQATHTFPITKDRKYNLILGGYGRVENHKPLLSGLIVGISVDFNGP